MLWGTISAHLQRVAHLIQIDAKLVARVRLDHVFGSELLRNLNSHANTEVSTESDTRQVRVSITVHTVRARCKPWHVEVHIDKGHYPHAKRSSHDHGDPSAGGNQALIHSTPGRGADHAREAQRHPAPVKCAFLYAI